MDNIEELFHQNDNVFTVFVVGQSFAVGRGYKYLNSFKNTDNYITTEKQLKRIFKKIVETVEKNIAPVSKLAALVFSGATPIGVTETITSLSKLFSVHEHQAVGPEVLDPIILQEGKITKSSITKIINLHKDSILRPAIIILLKDNDFDRAKILLSECPHGIHIKMIRNDGNHVLHKVINCGADSVDSFLSAFSYHCYSTGSNTKREILLNTELANNSYINQYSPLLLKFRTNLLFDQKEEIKTELSDFIDLLPNKNLLPENERKIIDCFECMSKLFRVFCNDNGGQDIKDAFDIATSLDNDILLAQVYRYSEFMPNYSLADKEELYDKGYNIFKKNSMNDLAIYCQNNKLIHQFYSDKVYPEEFRALQEEAINSVPGMVGLSHIYNNVGIAYLYCGQPNVAIDFFTRGLDYCKYQDRIVQNLALESNRMIAKSYSFITIEKNEILLLLRRIIDGMGLKKLPFIAADYALNIISIAYHQNIDFGYELINMFPIENLINTAFQTNMMGAGERILQMQYLDCHYGDKFTLLNLCKIPSKIMPAQGKRAEFIVKYGYNPFEFDTWL